MTDKEKAMFLVELAAMSFRTLEDALGEFTRRQGWLALGYGSFVAWYREDISFSAIHKALLCDHGSEEAVIAWWLKQYGTPMEGS